jgi:hypothetical protein
VLKIPPASNKALAKAADKFLHKSSGFHAAFANAQPLRKIGCARMTVALPLLIFMLILRNVLRFTVPFAANYRATARWLNAKSTVIAPMLQAENRLSHCANTQDVSGHL